MQIKSKKQQGFTIIEIMIVLAIAGLIMLIVFLAVPALQRTSRNTQRKNDAGNILTAIGTYVSNNNGSLPVSTTTPIATLISGVNLGYYTSTNIFYATSTSNPALCPSAGTGCTSSGTELTSEDVIYQAGVICLNNQSTTAGASTRSYVLLYAVETGGSAGIAEQCIGS